MICEIKFFFPVPRSLQRRRIPSSTTRQGRRANWASRCAGRLLREGELAAKKIGNCFFVLLSIVEPLAAAKRRAAKKKFSSRRLSSDGEHAPAATLRSLSLCNRNAPLESAWKTGLRCTKERGRYTPAAWLGRPQRVERRGERKEKTKRNRLRRAFFRGRSGDHQPARENRES